MGESERCEYCRGEVIYQLFAPGEAAWVCASCDAIVDIALHISPSVYRWSCSSCGGRYYSWTKPDSSPVCFKCRAS